MHITFLVHDIHFGGGGEKVTADIANYFAAKGDQVTIVSISTCKTENKFTIDARVNIESLNVALSRRNKLFRKIESVFEVKKYFRNVDYQSLLLGIGLYPSLLVALLPRGDHLIKIGCQVSSYSSVKHLWYILRWLLFRRLNVVISVTEYDVPYLQKLNRNVYVIPNSVSFYPDQPAELENKTILWIGRIDYLKGCDLLLEVFSRFCLNNKDWMLRIIGDGPLRETIKGTIAEKGLSDRVSVILSTEKIIEEYLDASVYLMTSRSEGLPLVLLEAQGCGLPVISFNCVTGPSEIINNGIDGYLIDHFNIDEMNAKLTALCADIGKRRELGKNARENVKKFLPDQIFNHWEALFSRLQSQIF